MHLSYILVSTVGSTDTLEQVKAAEAKAAEIEAKGGQERSKILESAKKEAGEIISWQEKERGELRESEIRRAEASIALHKENALRDAQKKISGMRGKAESRVEEQADHIVSAFKKAILK